MPSLREDSLIRKLKRLQNQFQEYSGLLQSLIDELEQMKQYKIEIEINDWNRDEW